MTSPEPAARAMTAAVRSACGDLADGHAATAVLTRLWRTAYAAGVVTGREPGPLPAAAGFLPDWARGRATGGWTWGIHAWAVPGRWFRYGGTDPEGPNCDRAALVLRAAARSGRLLMQLGDTGERTAVPALFWARGTVKGEEGHEDTGDGLQGLAGREGRPGGAAGRGAVVGDGPGGGARRGAGG